MLASKANRHASRQRDASRGSRRKRRPQLPNRRVSGRASESSARSGESTADSRNRADVTQPVRIRRGEFTRAPEAATNPPEERKARPAPRGVATAARSEGDPDSQLQLTLDLSDPKPRGYEASASPPRERIDTTRLLWLAMGMGAITCPILLGFQLVFTDPAHGLNVLAVVVTMSFGALFATWTFEYWLRRGAAATPQKLPTWKLTRHAILAAVGVAAMAVSALNRTASFGLLILVIFTLVVADIVLRRLRIR